MFFAFFIQFGVRLTEGPKRESSSARAVSYVFRVPVSTSIAGLQRADYKARYISCPAGSPCRPGETRAC